MHVAGARDTQLTSINNEYLVIGTFIDDLNEEMASSVDEQPIGAPTSGVSFVVAPSLSPDQVDALASYLSFVK